MKFDLRFFRHSIQDLLISLEEIILLIIFPDKLLTYFVLLVSLKKIKLKKYIHQMGKIFQIIQVFSIVNLFSYKTKYIIKIKWSE